MVRQLRGSAKNQCKPSWGSVAARPAAESLHSKLEWAARWCAEWCAERCTQDGYCSRTYPRFLSEAGSGGRKNTWPWALGNNLGHLPSWSSMLRCMDQRRGAEPQHIQEVACDKLLRSFQLLGTLKASGSSSPATCIMRRMAWGLVTLTCSRSRTTEASGNFRHHASAGCGRRGCEARTEHGTHCPENIAAVTQGSRLYPDKANQQCLKHAGRRVSVPLVPLALAEASSLHAPRFKTM